MTDQEPEFDLVDKTIDEFVINVRSEVSSRWKAWKIDFSKIEIHEVVGGLLARQATLAIEIVSNPPIWTAHISPVLLRAMADLHISLSWILKNPSERSQKFIAYGLGQMKLQIEHRKSKWEEEPPGEPEQLIVKAMEEWLDSQRFSFLTEVSVGSWSQESVRKMAEEAEELDFYNYTYTPFSSAAHSMWHHIELYNLTRCPNPLHRYHRVPVITELGLDPHNAILAAKYFDKSMRIFDQTFGIEVDVLNSYDLIYHAFADLFGQTVKDEIDDEKV